MATDHTNSHMSHGDVTYESRDLGHRGIFLFLVVLAISCSVIALAVWAMYAGLTNYANRNEPEQHPLAVQQPIPKPGFLQNTPPANMQSFPVPRLQSDEPADMNMFLSQEKQLLESQPWKDQSGAVHISIDQAMKVIASRGVPVRVGGTDPSIPDPMVVPNESGFKGATLSQSALDATAPEAPVEQHPVGAQGKVVNQENK